ncbi:glycosyltransferase family 4 protein [Actinopolymorpha rutila]|uniref:Glycosyltransferase involved in cell wall biosynthesis n=1 Tax=Actinopolymorpha rutila TaxID=446787 RepID=A0A852ZCM4_9ACTN|nr:glycosyltransferase involved in cell wall biosynthesis [Actinopolymorpha rutila]
MSDCFLPRLGGIEIQLAELTRMQHRAGHQVEVVTATPDSTGGDAAWVAAAGDRSGGPGVPVHRVVAPLPWELPVHPRTGRHVGRLYADLRPDVVHVHVGAVSPFGWAAVRAAARRRLPTVVTVHSMWDPATCAMYRALDAGAGWTGWAAVASTVSEAAAVPIRRVVGDRVPVRVVANGIDTAQWRPTGPGAAIELTEPTGRAGRRRPGVHVVAVGRLAPRKQPLTLLAILRAARSALDRRVPMYATVVGDGPARPLMHRYLRRHAMTDWVELTGRLDRDRVRAVLGSADVFLAPATRESFGIAALEARLAGVPVVAYERGGVADFVVSEKEGLLGGSPAELAAAVARLAGDDALRGTIAKYNRSTEPVRCTWPVVLADFDELYALARLRAGRSAP